MKFLAAAIATGALLATSHAAWSRKESAMKIDLTINGAPVAATLKDNATARDLLQLLPLTFAFRDYASAEKIAYPWRSSIGTSLTRRVSSTWGGSTRALKR